MLKFSSWFSFSGLMYSVKHKASLLFRCCRADAAAAAADVVSADLARSSFLSRSRKLRRLFGGLAQPDRALITYAFIFVLIGTIAWSPPLSPPSWGRSIRPAAFIQRSVPLKRGACVGKLKKGLRNSTFYTKPGFAYSHLP